MTCMVHQNPSRNLLRSVPASVRMLCRAKVLLKHAGKSYPSASCQGCLRQSLSLRKHLQALLFSQTGQGLGYASSPELLHASLWKRRWLHPHIWHALRKCMLNSSTYIDFGQNAACSSNVDCFAEKHIVQACNSDHSWDQAQHPDLHHRIRTELLTRRSLYVGTHLRAMPKMSRHTPPTAAETHSL